MSIGVPAFYHAAIWTPQGEYVSVLPHHYDGGFTLGEHAVIGNWFVEMVGLTLRKYPRSRVVWVGDTVKDGEILSKPALAKCFTLTQPIFETYVKEHYEAIGTMKNAVKIADKIKDVPDCGYYHRYWYNLDKNEYVDLKMYMKLHGFVVTQGEQQDKSEIWASHPIPYLLAIGNLTDDAGYHDINEDQVGRWAGDRLMVTNNKDEIPADATKITYEFISILQRDE